MSTDLLRRSQRQSRTEDLAQLILKCASASGPSGVLTDDGAVIGRIMRANAAPEGAPWMWTLAFGHHDDRTPTDGYEATRGAAMAAFAKSWRRE
jgi:hypothetical protein